MVEFGQLNRKDPHTVSNFEVFLSKHIDLCWKLDFESKSLSGYVIIAFERVNCSNETALTLDASELRISSITLLSDGGAETKLQFTHSKNATKFGGSLTFNLPEALDSFAIRIDYETMEGCSALQWLSPAQTYGKKHPFMFSQCQAIHARTMLPCQDTPMVKTTFSALIQAPSPMTAVMSANVRNVEESQEGFNSIAFKQTTPIPAYLIAIGAGDLKSKDIGPRSSVWCEQEVLEAAAYEFADTEAFIACAEEIVTPYVWGRYDILLLPASFPYGGMENPCLTFLTPSLLAGDRSLVNVVAHEISHSWTGNLVTNSSWIKRCVGQEHFWLNEGFTVFLENKIAGRISGEAERQFQAHIGLAELLESVEEFGPDSNLTRLVPDLSSTNPDDAFSRIPYEKGHTFLYYLEELVGGAAVFEDYLRAHIKAFSGKSLSTKDWQDFLLKYFLGTPAGKKLEAVDWQTWLFGTGMPPVIPDYDKTLLNVAESISEKWLNGCPPKDDQLNFRDSLNPGQKIMCLEFIDRKSAGKLSVPVLQGLDARYSLSSIDNVEIAMKWFMLCLHNRYEAVFEMAAAFAAKHGRMKYCRPIYKALYNCGSKGRQIALDTFTRHRDFYHPIAAKMIAKDLEFEQ